MNKVVIKILQGSVVT